MAHYSDWQYEIYEEGLRSGEPPQWPVDYESLEVLAKTVMTPQAYAYVAGNASAGITAQTNREAFTNVKLRPHILRGPIPRDHTTTLFGIAMPAPIIVAPIGALSIVHPEAEPGAAKAAASLNLTFVHSTNSTTTMEEVAAAVGNASRWYQMYIPKDRKLAQSFVQRAEKSGYTAIMVTLDTTTRAWRPKDLNLGHLPFIAGTGIANYLADPVFRSLLAKTPEEDLPTAVQKWREIAADPTLNWEAISWIRQQTKLPIILKGILHPDDAAKACEIGVDGIVVSNHGGRQLDGAISSLEALPDVVRSVNNRMPILFDSGIRTGSDCVKALALGADAILLGRPWVWGLALGGSEGVIHALRCFLADYDVALGLTGYKTPGELSPADVITK